MNDQVTARTNSDILLNAHTLDHCDFYIFPEIVHIMNEAQNSHYNTETR